MALLGLLTERWVVYTRRGQWKYEKKTALYIMYEPVSSLFAMGGSSKCFVNKH